MKNYFFVNPAAGQGKNIQVLIEEIHRTTEMLNKDSVVYITEGVGDGEAKAREFAEKLNGEEGRFFACGGDRTNSEIVNGIVGFENIAVGCVPIGTGNDTVRSLGPDKDFLNIEGQLCGTDRQIDLIKYAGVLNGKMQERYCVNMFNIGFDCNVVELAARLNQSPLLRGILHIFLRYWGFL